MPACRDALPLDVLPSPLRRHLATPQVTPGLGCRLSVVLRGYQFNAIGADWSDDEMDEFCVAPLD